MKKTASRGFTLIELMVAITIIGILSAGAMAAFNNARASARDAKRYSAMAQIQLALETYRQVNGSYPSTSGAWWGVCSAFGSHVTSGSNGYVPNIATTYMTVLPLDPVNSTGCSGGSKGYLYRSDGTDYKFLVYQTVELKKECDQTTDIYYDPVRSPSEATCGVYTTGALNW